LALVVFDLDETLISGDSDYEWGEYVVDKNLVEAESHRRQNKQFYEDYKRGDLDIEAYLRFTCRVLSIHDREILFRHRASFINERIKPLVLPKAIELVQSHRQKGDILIVVTATMEFITSPIVALFGIDHLIAPVPEVIDGRYTGEISGTASFGKGKVARLNSWLSDAGLSLEGSYFYSDSANDLPLLELVDNPVAVDPDDRLEEFARAKQWPIISLRN